MRGDTPIGVHYNKTQKKYQASCHVDGKLSFLGYYKTVEEAFNAYKKVKEAYIKEVATKWKDKIDPKVYDALMNWVIEITD